VSKDIIDADVEEASVIRYESLSVYTLMKYVAYSVREHEHAALLP